jgi:hypothetical protein
MKARSSKRRPVAEAERQQVRARRIVGHDFALASDEHGRQRLVAGTAEAARRYEIAGGGKTVRVRRVDPLSGISSLTPLQRRAGMRYRDDCEAANIGIRSAILEERVDVGRSGGGLPAALLGKGQDFHAANRAIGHADIVEVVAGICVAGHSVTSLAAKTGDTRDVVAKLLKIGLDNLARHYAAGREGRSALAHK